MNFIAHSLESDSLSSEALSETWGAGLLLDALIAERLMEGFIHPYSTHGPSSAYVRTILNDHGFGVLVYANAGEDSWSCEIYRGDEEFLTPDARAEAPTEALAVCRAALVLTEKFPERFPCTEVGMMIASESAPKKRALLQGRRVS